MIVADSAMVTAADAAARTGSIAPKTKTAARSRTKTATTTTIEYDAA